MKITPELVLEAYRHALFPMADDDGGIAFYTADPRAILPLEAFHVPRRLARTVRQGVYEIRFDTAFREVVESCAGRAPGRERTWISPEMTLLYAALHDAGHAHSVECWAEGALAGGLYGVALGGLFAGESMFSRARDASKVALVHLVERLRARGFVLLDSQFLASDHLRQFNALEIPAREYRRRLDHALALDVRF